MLADEQITYITTDHLGSPIMGTDEKGQVVWRQHYTPYGTRLEVIDPNYVDGYTGHYQEPNTGLVYAGARWYDPELGRFLSVDPKGFSGDNVLSFNRYAYGNDNPYRYADPDGLSPIAADAALILGGGAVIGTIGYTQLTPAQQTYIRTQISQGADYILDNTAIGWMITGSGILSSTLLNSIHGGNEENGGDSNSSPRGPSGGDGNENSPPPGIDDVRYQNYWQRHAPRQPEPYSTYRRYTENGNIKQVTTYDEFGARHRQYDLMDSRQGEHQHKFDYGQSNPRPNNGIRSEHLPIK